MSGTPEGGLGDDELPPFDDEEQLFKKRKEHPFFDAHSQEHHSDESVDIPQFDPVTDDAAHAVVESGLESGLENDLGNNDPPPHDDEAIVFEKRDEPHFDDAHDAQSFGRNSDGSVEVPEYDPVTDDTGENIVDSGIETATETETEGHTQPSEEIRTRKTPKRQGTIVSTARTVSLVLGLGVFTAGASIGGIYAWFAHSKKLVAEEIAKSAESAKNSAVQEKNEAVKKSEESVSIANAANTAKEKAEKDRDAANDDRDKANKERDDAVIIAGDAVKAKKSAEADRDTALKVKNSALKDKEIADANAAAATKDRDKVFGQNVSLASFTAKAGAVEPQVQESVLKAVAESEVKPPELQKLLAAQFAIRQAIQMHAVEDAGADEKLNEALGLADAAEAAAKEANDIELQALAIYLGAQVLEIQGKFDDSIDRLQRAIGLTPAAKTIVRLRASSIRVRTTKLREIVSSKTSQFTKPKAKIDTFFVDQRKATQQQIRLVSVQKEPSIAELQELVNSASLLIEGADAQGALDPICWHALAYAHLTLADHVKFSTGKEPNINAVPSYIAALKASKMALTVYRKTPVAELDDLNGQLLSNLAEVQDLSMEGRLSFETNDVLEQLAANLERANQCETKWKEWAVNLAQEAPFEFKAPLAAADEQSPTSESEPKGDNKTAVTADEWRKNASSQIKSVTRTLELAKTREGEWFEWARSLGTENKFEIQLPSEETRWSKEGNAQVNSWRNEDSSRIQLSTAMKRFRGNLQSKWDGFAESAAKIFALSPPPQWNGGDVEAEDVKAESDLNIWQAKFLKKLGTKSGSKKSTFDHEAKEAFAKGLDLFFRRCRAEAEDQFTKAIELAPRNPGAYYFRALTRNENWWCCHSCGIGCQDHNGNTGEHAEGAAEDVKTGALLELQGATRSPTFLKALERVQGCARNWLDSEIKRATDSSSPPAPGSLTLNR